MHDNPQAPPKFLPAASIPYYHMGLEQLCQRGLLHDRELVPNLVKIASHFKDKPSDMMNSGDQRTTMTILMYGSLPTSPIVLRELHGREVAYRNEHMLWFDAPAQASDPDRVTNQRKDALRSRELHFHLEAMDKHKVQRRQTNMQRTSGILQSLWLSHLWTRRL